MHRLTFALFKYHYDEHINAYKFKSQDSIIHINEKHFYLTREIQTYYIAPGEVEPCREIQSKRFISKILFMSAVIKPIHTSNGDVIFDGKLGICLFSLRNQEPAKMRSKNKKKEELETKPIQSITKEHMRTMLITNVIPTIRAKWPNVLSKDIIIQPDNAKPHITPNGKEIVDEATKDGFNIQLVQQPSNSPNINDIRSLFL